MNLAKDTNDIYQPTDFSKIKIGLQTLEDAIVSYGTYSKTNARLGSKTTVLEAINNGDVKSLREISDFFYKTSGIYRRLCRYMAFLYKYDWFITPYINGCQGLLDTDSGIADDTVDQAQQKERKKIFDNFFQSIKIL